MATFEVPKNTSKRDALMAIEESVQQVWDSERVFEIDAPSLDSKDANQEKFMMTFPYPYMNGRLHLGHSFSLSKCEFAAGWERLKGKRVLFPFGFHCTGMPIKACADKLRREIEQFGNPPQFPQEEEEAEEEEAAADTTNSTAAAVDGKPAIRKKGKIASKSTGKKYQWDIMKSMGVPDEEIHRFADAKHWLYYFPPLAINDLKRLGVKVDWRRSFITTDVNPYYDSFVRWQFRRLKALDKIKFGKRYTIFSPLDNQPCMDHDRQTGEGVAPQEYTLIKLQLVEPFPQPLKFLEEKKKVFFTAATLRPETMYGQTNCFVGPALDYGAFEITKDEVFICTERSALNLAYQGYAQTEGKVVKLAALKGEELVGCRVKAPLAKYDHVYVLPMESVLATKGTGVVTSVPSDSPDDYMTLSDLKKKCAYYKIKEEWVQGYEPIPIINTPNYGNLAAVKVCEELKINSPKDRKQLDLAKEKVYKEGFYSGTMALGDFIGKPVQEAKPLIRQQMIERGEACPYWEPENIVMSRSGDECVVCLTDQWYLNYGEDEWKAAAFKCLETLNTYHEETKNQFSKTLDWLREWACSRSYGLGSRLPWDEQWLIESLSDSTIYMAYYTVAHLLQSGALDGSKSGSAGIKADQLTDDVWNYIFSDKTPVPKTDIPIDKLNQLKREFNYFYPLDLRVSGKDLISNHLTFFIYNHVALFEQKKWPLSVRANGHLLINNEKMSKSTGNFLTLTEAVSMFSADGTRFALAEAGDGVEDANFAMDKANSGILKLFTLKEWMDTTIKEIEQGQLRSGPMNSFNDQVFMNELSRLTSLAAKAYDNMLYYDAMKWAFHEMLNAKDRYVLVAGTTHEPMHQDVVKRYMEVQALAMCPITPHISEYIWRTLLKKPESIMRATWPQLPAADEGILAAKDYIDRVVRDVRLAMINEQQPKKGKKGAAAAPVDPPKPPTGVSIFITTEYPDWQLATMDVLKTHYNKETRQFDDMKTITQAFAQHPVTKTLIKNKKFMPFVRQQMNDIQEKGPSAFERRIPFQEQQTLETNQEFIKLTLGLQHLCLTSLDSETSADCEKAKSVATPGDPFIQFTFE